MRRDIDEAIRAADELVKRTELSYPNRASIRGFLGAALIMNADPTEIEPRHIAAELKAHLGDALKPLGLRAVRRESMKKKAEISDRKETPDE